MAIHRMQHGTLTTGPFDGRFRHDTYTPYSEGAPLSEPALAAGPGDESPRHDHMLPSYGGGYDPSCSACWLHFIHTDDYHESAVAGR